MDKNKLMKESSDRIMLYVREIKQSNSHNININDGLYIAELAKNRMEQSAEDRNNLSVIKWAEIADEIYGYMMEEYQNNHHKFLYKRIQTRLRLIEVVGKVQDIAITTPSIIIEWLRKEFSSYDIDEVQELIQIWQNNPQSINSASLLSLRHLRYWVVCLKKLDNVKEISGADDLIKWLKYIELLP